MNMAAASPSALSFILKPKLLHFITTALNNSLFPSTQSSSRRRTTTYSSYPKKLPDGVRLRPKTTTKWRLSATNGGLFFLSETTSSPIESSQEIVATTSGDDGVATVISALLLIAFIGLSILTIGVVYIAVTDFLQKREREKFEKEEAAKKKKKSGKKGRVGARARGGPRGFGQKIEEDDDDVDLD
ncbi:hypothetical protein BUALT_Bualt02G0068500 [Buddleja alternifolia]|uniref:Transmembrane protein n=1 Tax=Buddleja alternifolia TaxID=168488 RepID=A0AAV6Y2A4_9LAMI|nr:hypothetical protein BUALT_Bualt02G0068500 [Buddleja alternifolia]